MDWSIQDWGAVGEVVGAAAIVATLGYLAMQIRENSRQLRLTSTLSINSLMNEGFDPIYNNEKNMQIWTTGLKSPDVLSDGDLEIFLLFMTRLLNPFDTVVMHHRLGALDTEDFDKYVLFFGGLIRTPGGERWLAANHFQLTQESRKVLDVN